MLEEGLARWIRLVIAEGLCDGGDFLKEDRKVICFINQLFLS